MSQNFDIGSTFIFIPKKGKILIISLQMNLLIRHVKYYACTTNIKGDILVQKIKVKKSIFKFPTASLNSLLIKLYMINTSK